MIFISDILIKLRFANSIVNVCQMQVHSRIRLEILSSTVVLKETFAAPRASAFPPSDVVMAS